MNTPYLFIALLLSSTALHAQTFEVDDLIPQERNWGEILPTDQALKSEGNNPSSLNLEDFRPAPRDWGSMLPTEEEMTSPEAMEAFNKIGEDIARHSGQQFEAYIQDKIAGSNLEKPQDPDEEWRERVLPAGYRATILVSTAMGEEHLQRLFARYQDRGDLRFVFRGVPEDWSVPDFSWWLAELLQLENAKSAPNILIDPNLFAVAGTSLVPTVMIEDLTNGSAGAALGSDIGQPAMIAIGLSDPDYVFEQLEDGETSLFQGSTVAAVEEDIIVRAKREAQAIEDRMSKDPEVIRERYWSSLVTKMDRAGITPAPQDILRELHFAYIPHETIKDSDGKVLAHAGQVFMPSEVMTFDRRIFVFDARRQSELDLVRQRLQMSMAGVRKTLFIATGLEHSKERSGIDALQALVDEFQQPVYLMNDTFKNGFQIRHTPTEIYPEAFEERIRVVAAEYKTGDL